MTGPRCSAARPRRHEIDLGVVAGGAPQPALPVARSQPPPLAPLPLLARAVTPHSNRRCGCRVCRRGGLCSASFGLSNNSQQLCSLFIQRPPGRRRARQDVGSRIDWRVHAVVETSGLCEPARGRADHPAELLGDDHAGTSSETPLRPDAFVLSDEEKIAAIEPLFGQVPCYPRCPSRGLAACTARHLVPPHVCHLLPIRSWTSLASTERTTVSLARRTAWRRCTCRRSSAGSTRNRPVWLLRQRLPVQRDARRGNITVNSTAAPLPAHRRQRTSPTSPLGGW